MKRCRRTCCQTTCEQLLKLAKLVADYRAAEKKLQPDRTIGSVADWNEGRDERIGIRGSYTEFGEEVPRGNISFLGGAAERRVPTSSGRLELALNIANDQNPLTARVFVNRVWLHLVWRGTRADAGRLWASGADAFASGIT